MDVTWPNQCIVFDLPSGAAGMSAGTYKSMIMKHVQAFVAHHAIEFVTVTREYKMRLWFPDNSYYAVFFLWYPLMERQWRRPFLADESYPYS